MKREKLYPLWLQFHSAVEVSIVVSPSVPMMFTAIASLKGVSTNSSSEFDIILISNYYI